MLQALPSNGHYLQSLLGDRSIFHNGLIMTRVTSTLMWQVEGKFKENLKFQNALPLQLKIAGRQNFISIRDGHENFVPTTRLMFPYTEYLTEYIKLTFQ
jgi:hypothetical protein